MTELLTILVIENHPDDVAFLKTTLKKLQEKEIEFELEIVSSLEEAYKAMNARKYDVILMNLFLPDSEGLETFLEVQKKVHDVPIIIVGESEEMAEEAVKLGAQDFLSKTELTADSLTRMIHHAIARNRLQESLKALSFTDELTGVFNRRGFLTFLVQQMELAKRTKRGFYLFIIDLDHLKQINDSYGHLVGDQALIDVAGCLLASFRRHDVVGRIGGDEFAIIALNASVESGDYLKQNILDQVKEQNEKTEAPYRLALSIGQAFFDGSSKITSDQLFQKADEDLYHQKRLPH